jgi:hypothetical protein
VSGENGDNIVRTDASALDLTAAMREYRPARIVAYLTDGSERNVSAKGGGRKRWHKARLVLDTLNWQRIEFFDDDNGLVYVYPPADAAGTGDDGDGIGGDAVPEDRDMKLLHMLIVGQRAATEHTEKIITPVLKANADAIEMLAKRLGDLESRMGRAFQLAGEAVEQVAIANAQATLTPDDGADGTVNVLAGQLLHGLGMSLGPTLGPQLAQLIPRLLGGGGSPPQGTVPPSPDGG